MSNATDYVNERVEPDRSGYYDVTTLTETSQQVMSFHKSLGVGELTELAVIPWQGQVPQEADGLIAIPALSDLGRIFGVPDPLGQGYGLLLERVLTHRQKYQLDIFYVFQELVPLFHNVRLHGAIKECWQALEAKYSADQWKLRVFLLPVNTGKLYQGFSPRYARIDALSKPNRLPLDPVSGACILRNWYHRLASREYAHHELWMDCPGAESSSLDNGNFSHTVYFGEPDLDDGQARWIVPDFKLENEYRSKMGSGVIFLPD